MVGLGMDEPVPESELDGEIAAYAKGVDRTLLRENLKLTIPERLEKFTGVLRSVFELRACGERLRAR